MLIKNIIIKKHTGIGILSTALCAFLWSTAGIFIKMVDANPIAIAGARSVIAAFMIFIYLKRLKLTWSIPQVGAAAANSLTMLLFVAANKLTTSANAILLQYAAPIYVAVLAYIFLKEKIKLFDLLTIIFVLAGMIFFFFDKIESGNALGNILAILSGITFAVFFVFMRKQKDGSNLESLFLSHIITALIAVPFYYTIKFNPVSLTGIILLGVFQIGLASILFSIGIKYLTAIQTVLITIIEPLFNPVWVFIFLHEKPTLFALIGGGIIIIAVTIRQIISIAYKK